MLRHLFRALLVVLLLAPAAFAQTTSATTGAVNGAVSDSSGATSRTNSPVGSSSEWRSPAR